MTTAREQSRFRVWILFLYMVTLAAGGLNWGCVHATAQKSVASIVTGDLCVGTPAEIRGAAEPPCTAAQRICFLVRELPAALGQPDFIPSASYAARWQPQVQQWRLQLTELTLVSSLAPYAHAAQRQLMWLDGSEHDRRLSIEHGDLLHALAVLVRNAKGTLPSPGVDCALSE